MLLAVGCDLKKKPVATSYTNGMLGTANINGTAYAVALKNNFAYVTDNQNNRLNVINVSDPNKPSILTTINIQGQAHGICISGNYAYVAHSGGLDIVDISNLATPTRIGSVNTVPYYL